MAQVLCVYRQGSVPKKAAAATTKKNKPSKAVTVIFSDDGSPAISRALQRPLRTCRPNPAHTRASFATMRTSATARSGLLVGIDLGHRQGPCPGRGPPPQSRVHRISQADRCRLSYPYDDPSDPRQSFRTHLQGDESLARQPTGGSLRIHSTLKHALLAEPGRGFFLKSSPAPSCATSASHPNRNSRTASWPPWITSTKDLSSIHGPANSKRPPDMSQIKETLNQHSPPTAGSSSEC